MISINPDNSAAYPYVGIAAETDRILNIAATGVEIISKAESAFFEEDYLPTSRSVDLDMDRIDALVHTYIGPFDYRILVYFNEHKHIVLTYHSPTNEAPKDYDIFDGYPEPRARQLVDTLYPIFLSIRDEVELLDV